MAGMKRKEIERKGFEVSGVRGFEEKPRTHATTQPRTSASQRIAKVLARAGIASRREAERMILEGKVSVDGKVITSPALNITEKNSVTIDGKPLHIAAEAKLYRYYKPAGLITTARDPEGRPTLFAHLPKNLPRLVSVGRLDINSEGLLLLTNDGELARYMELPKNELPRSYRVRIHKGDRAIPANMFDRLKSGMRVDGMRYAPIDAHLEHDSKSANAWLQLTLREGKNREIRKIMEFLGFKVNRLIRIAYGPFQLGKLMPGEVDEIPQRVLREQLKDYFSKNPA